jgi:hypothetical protein
MQGIQALGRLVGNDRFHDIQNSLAGSRTSTAWAISNVTSLPDEANWSSSEMASRMEPVAWRATSVSASGCTWMPSPSACAFKVATNSLTGMRRNSWRWQRDSTVAGILCTSVVARIKMACEGGSSSVLSSALKAAVESMCTSSTI